MKLKGQRQSKRVTKAKPFSKEREEAFKRAKSVTGGVLVPNELVNAVAKAQKSGKDPSPNEKRKILNDARRKQQADSRKADREILKKIPRKDRDKADKDVRNALQTIKRDIAEKKYYRQ